MARPASSLSWFEGKVWNGLRLVPPTAEQLAELEREGFGGVPGAFAARLLPALIERAASGDKQKLRKLLCHEIDLNTVFSWKATPGYPDKSVPLTSELHWRLYETLARNPKLPAVLAKLATNNAGSKRKYDYRDSPNCNYYTATYPETDLVAGWGEVPAKPVAQAKSVLVKLAKAARRWCYQTDDADKFAFMETEPLYKGEMQLRVAELFFDMPRYGTGQVAQWWWDKHQRADDEPPDQAPFPAQWPDPFGGTYAPEHWCVLKMRGRRGKDPDGYEHGEHGMRTEKHCAEQGIEWPIFKPVVRGMDEGSEGSLYEHGAGEICYGLQASPFKPHSGDWNMRCVWTHKNDREPNLCGRKCLHILLPSFGFWFALGLPRSLLVREDRMVYRWWLVSRRFKRAYFQARLATMKASPAFNAVFLAPGAWGYRREALASEAARLMVGADQGSGRLT